MRTVAVFSQLNFLLSFLNNITHHSLNPKELISSEEAQLYFISFYSLFFLAHQSTMTSSKFVLVLCSILLTSLVTARLFRYDGRTKMPKKSLSETRRPMLTSKSTPYFPGKLSAIELLTPAHRQLTSPSPNQTTTSFPGGFIQIDAFNVGFCDDGSGRSGDRVLYVYSACRTDDDRSDLTGGHFLLNASYFDRVQNCYVIKVHGAITRLKI